MRNARAEFPVDHIDPHIGQQSVSPRRRMHAIVTEEPARDECRGECTDARNVNPLRTRSDKRRMDIRDTDPAVAGNAVDDRVVRRNGCLGDCSFTLVEGKSVRPWVLGMKPEWLRRVDPRREGAYTIVGIPLSRRMADQSYVRDP